MKASFILGQKKLRSESEDKTEVTHFEVFSARIALNISDFEGKLCVRLFFMK